MKTLHPRIHGGLLCRRDKPEHLAEAEKNGIELIDLVVVNLYPFEQTVAKPGVSFEERSGLNGLRMIDPELDRRVLRLKTHQAVWTIMNGEGAI